MTSAERSSPPSPWPWIVATVAVVVVAAAVAITVSRSQIEGLGPKERQSKAQRAATSAKRAGTAAGAAMSCRRANVKSSGPSAAAPSGRGTP